MLGKCLCGGVRFEIVGPLPKLYQCHCSLCRKQGGSASNSALLVVEEHFRWLEGRQLISSWVKDTGFRSDFCSHCGSPVPNPLRGNPLYWVPAGLLESDQGLEVGAHLFVSEKAGWEVAPAAGEQFDTAPGLDVLSELLHVRT